MDKRVIVFSTERHDSTWPPEKLLEFSAWLAEKVERIPTEYRHRASIEFSSSVSYDSAESSLCIEYWRPETDGEREERESRSAAAAAETQRRELRILAELRAKYDA